MAGLDPQLPQRFISIQLIYLNFLVWVLPHHLLHGGHTPSPCSLAILALASSPVGLNRKQKTANGLSPSRPAPNPGPNVPERGPKTNRCAEIGPEPRGPGPNWAPKVTRTNGPKLGPKGGTNKWAQVSHGSLNRPGTYNCLFILLPGCPFSDGMS